MHSIQFDATRRLLVATCIGFWSDDDQQAFERELMAAIDDRRREGGLDLVFDVTAQPPQSAAVVDRQRALSARIATRGIRRMAIVVTSRLLSNQLARVRRGTETDGPSDAPPTSVRYFDDRASADRWLAAPPDPAK